MKDITTGIVGIRAKPDSRYSFAGTGFIVHGGLIVTCAHVVRQADDLNNKWRFQVEGDEHILTAVLTQIDDHLDIAILTPTAPMLDVEPLKLLNSNQSKGHTFSTFGYPQVGNYLGLPGAGKILGAATDKSNRAAVVFESTQVTHGYSGCPLWDNELQAVVGMVSSGFAFGLDKKLGDVGFAIPCETLKQFCPQLVMGEAPAPPPPVTWNLKHPYGMPPNFTGRKQEQADLTHWLTEDSAHPLLIVRALGGFGKSALAWHWLTHEVDKVRWPYVLWWSFYEGDASFDSFLAEALRYLLGDKAELPAGPRLQAERLRDELRQSDNVLLILDGFERMLRAFQGMNAAYQGDDETREQAYNERDCISPAAEAFLHDLASLGELVKSKVLMTTRLRPCIVEGHGGLLAGCAEHALTALAPTDAVEFFQRQDIRGTYTEIESACKTYGYHPLSLRLLAGLIAYDFKMSGDIRAAQKLDISGDLRQRHHHVLEVAYNTLPSVQKTLFSRIACFRGSVEYDALKAIADLPEKDLDTALHALIERGLLQRTKTDMVSMNFDLHPIVRRYAYDRLAAPDRAAAHTRLRDYFDAVPKPDKAQKLEDLAPLIELYYHTVRAGQLDEAKDLLEQHLIPNPLYFQFAAYQLCIELLRVLFLDGDDKPLRLKSESAQGWTLNCLAIAYSMNGQPRRAVPVFEQAIKLAEKQDDKRNLAVGLGAVALVAYMPIGSLRAADTNHRRRIALCREIEDGFGEAVGHQDLGQLLDYLGAWAGAEQEFSDSLAIAEKTRHVQNQGVTWAYRAQHALWMTRAEPARFSIHCSLATDSARQTLALAEKVAHIRHPYERDFVRAHWLLGASLYAAGSLAESDVHLSEALQRCRAINMVDHEADILLDMARQRQAQGNTAEAFRFAQEALTITERSGYVLQGADVHLFFAQQDPASLKNLTGLAPLEHAREALRLATCDGEPYVYRVAYDEAQALVKKLEAKA